MFKSYGVAVGEGKGKIGPRHLTIPTKKATGSLKMEREFVFASSLFDKVTITIKKTDGKAGADIAACVKYANGDSFNQKNKSISKGKDSKGDSVKFVFTDMADKILTLRLVRTGFVTDICHYSVSAILSETMRDRITHFQGSSHFFPGVRTFSPDVESA